MANKPTPFDVTNMLWQHLGPLSQFIDNLDIQEVDRGQGGEYMVAIRLVVPFGALSLQSKRTVLTKLNGAGIQPTAVSHNGVQGTFQGDIAGKVHIPVGTFPDLSDAILGDVQDGTIDIGDENDLARLGGMILGIDPADIEKIVANDPSVDEAAVIAQVQKSRQDRPTLEADGDAPEVNVEAAPLTFEPAEIKPTVPDEQITPPSPGSARPPIKVAKRLGAQPMTQDQIRSMLSGGE